MKRDLHRKEESRKHEKKRVKEHLKKKFRDKSSYGTSSADGSHFPTPSDRSSGGSGSAPAPSGCKGEGKLGMILLDPLDSAYVARNGEQKVEKAIHWDWNDGNDEDTSPPSLAPDPTTEPNSVLRDATDLTLRKGDLNDPYLDCLQDCGAGDDYNFSDNYLKNTHESSSFTPYLSAPAPSAPPSISVFPPIDSIKSTSTRNSCLESSEIKPSLPLSISFAQMISSNSRPLLSTGKGGSTTIPSAVEKVLKRRKKPELKSKEEKK